MCFIQGPCDFETYLSRLPIHSQRAAADESSCLRQGLHALWAALRDLPLHGLYIPGGVFYHLGTSWELQILQCAPLWGGTEGAVLGTVGNQSAGGVLVHAEKDKLRSLRDKYLLRRSVHSVIAPPHIGNCFENPSSRCDSGGDWGQSFVAIGSSVSVSPPGEIGTGSVIENCVLHGRIHIGEGCILSHIGSELGDSLVLPGHTMVQQVPLRREVSLRGDMESPLRTANIDEFVAVVLGVRDDIKATSQSAGTPYSSPNACFYFQCPHVKGLRYADSP